MPARRLLAKQVRLSDWAGAALVYVLFLSCRMNVPHDMTWFQDTASFEISFCNTQFDHVRQRLGVTVQ